MAPPGGCGWRRGAGLLIGSPQPLQAHMRISGMFYIQDSIGGEGLLQVLREKLYIQGSIEGMKLYVQGSIEGEALRTGIY